MKHYQRELTRRQAQRAYTIAILDETIYALTIARARLRLALETAVWWGGGR